ncbi:hypothetical protein [Micromonospora sp. NPDC006431]|uniref:hypothetical protein n=1 Tax=Micromonospora sp. NPDC006431 TaxID=3364235 RepID=UPI0036ACD02D
MTPPALLTLLTERETAAGLVAERLREQITSLTDQLTAAETELAELAITRKTLRSLTGHTDPPAAADVTVASPAYNRPEMSGTPARATGVEHSSCPLVPVRGTSYWHVAGTPTADPAHSVAHLDCPNDGGAAGHRP